MDRRPQSQNDCRAQATTRQARQQAQQEEQMAGRWGEEALQQWTRKKQEKLFSID
jgi:hypothetical protein